MNASAGFILPSIEDIESRRLCVMASRHLYPISGIVGTVSFISLSQSISQSIQLITGISFFTKESTSLIMLSKDRFAMSRAMSSDCSVECGLLVALELCQCRMLMLSFLSASIVTNPSWECFVLRF